MKFSNLFADSTSTYSFFDLYAINTSHEQATLNILVEQPFPSKTQCRQPLSTTPLVSSLLGAQASLDPILLSNFSIPGIMSKRMSSLIPNRRRLTSIRMVRKGKTNKFLKMFSSYPAYRLEVVEINDLADGAFTEALRGTLFNPAARRSFKLLEDTSALLHIAAPVFGGDTTGEEIFKVRGFIMCLSVVSYDTRVLLTAQSTLFDKQPKLASQK
jgi:hypothetical protein